MGYVGIVQLLLEYDGDKTVRNGRKQTPLECAHNGIILSLLKK